MLVCDHDLNHDNNHKYRYESVKMVDVQSISSVISKILAFCRIVLSLIILPFL